MYTFVPNKPVGSLLEISPANHIFLKAFNSEFKEIKVWFTDQTSKLLKVEDKINLTIIKMHYSIEPRDARYVKDYGFLSFAKNICKNINSKYSQKLVGSAKMSAADAIKTISKTAIQKTAETTGDLICNRTANKITSASKKKSLKELPSNEANNEIPKERYISAQDRHQIIEELRLI